MQLFKHVEVVLMLAFGLLCATFALQPTGSAQRASVAGMAAPAVVAGAIARTDALVPMPVVNVVGHRLTPEEKRAVDNAG